jgi:hypothetical protein
MARRTAGDAAHMRPMTTERPTIMSDPQGQHPEDASPFPGSKTYNLDELVQIDTVSDPLSLVSEPACDRFRDLWKDNPELAGKVVLTCDKPLGHDRRGGHRMRSEAGETICTWTGPADND